MVCEIFQLMTEPFVLICFPQMLGLCGLSLVRGDLLFASFWWGGIDRLRFEMLSSTER